MPIRLVVAITVGTAAMSLLVPMLDGVEETDRSMVTVEPDRSQVVLEPGSSRDITVDVVTTDGKPVEGSTVVLSSGSAPLEYGPHTFESGPDSHSVTVTVGESSAADLTVDFRTTQARGTIEIGVVPPARGEYDEWSEHPEITVSKAN
jgi:hypothetical protein